jgi:SAM-dependent methyltransferase
MTEGPIPSPRDQWEERYRSEVYFYGTEPNGFLADHVADLPVGRILCLAEGEGRNAVFLAERGFSVSSVDLTRAGVDKTLRLASARGTAVDASVGDLADFDLGTACWDGIVSVFAHIPKPIRIDLHQRVTRALRPGGVFLLEAYRPAQVGRGTGGPPTAELMMSLEELRGELSPLEVTFGAETDREIIEGSGHTGGGAVVQFIARKPLV